MARKRAADTKHRKKSSRTSLKRTLEAAITSNPFLNFFLSKCRVKGNAKLHKFAKKAGDQWKEMSYHEKTPYYLLADKARISTVKKTSKKRRFSESDIGEGSFTMITVIKKPESMMRSSTEAIENKTNQQEMTKDTEVEQQTPEGFNEGSSKVPDNPSVIDNAQKSVKIEKKSWKKRAHRTKPNKKNDSISSLDISSGSTSFHSIQSDDSVQKDSKRQSKKARSWTDSFDYMG